MRIIETFRMASSDAEGRNLNCTTWVIAMVCCISERKEKRIRMGL